MTAVLSGMAVVFSPMCCHAIRFALLAGRFNEWPVKRIVINATPFFNALGKTLPEIVPCSIICRGY
jgi:hypothetical protein